MLRLCEMEGGLGHEQPTMYVTVYKRVDYAVFGILESLA